MQKVLVANRGEIASRIIRTCQARGIKTVSVYSEADQELPFVEQADESVCIGPPPVAKSYLQMDAIIGAAQETGADAIHPGYGLLSENAEFAQKVIDAGLTWIGPAPAVIALMGDKVMARKTMQKAGVPTVPGTDQIQNVEEAIHAAEQIGFPVMIKASAGGGGIGMHVCHTAEELNKIFSSVQTRARSYFGDDTLFMEKWIGKSRHVEVQIIADSQGHVLHLFERECSVQRRNQKVIEESLSPSIRPETRKRLHDAAMRAAQAVQYTGAGTVEFLVGPDDVFYFLEMNTRLQVEHPVTECITGLDLVSLQLDIACGQPLPFKQEEIQSKGHAIEFRIYAEDPIRFMPAPGKITRFRFPDGKGIRVDAGVKEGNTVSPFYDPLIAKCIVSGCNRQEVIEKSKDALQAFEVEGIQTNIPALLRVLEEPQFVKGHYHTQLLDEMRQR
nr:acetyl-CoA carboxylase biotin carboxylase subunit [Thermoflavimicrobium dichotomicum]